MNPRLDKRGIITNICSLLLAAIFVFSGFSKAVDPVGGAIKIGEYLALRDYWKVVPWLETRLGTVLSRHLERYL